MKKYGPKLGKAILNDDWMQGITVTTLPNGEMNIPDSDVERALKHIRGKSISEFEWD